MKEKLLALWHQQSDRDKRLLSIGGVVVFFYLFYALCYSPLSSSVESYQQRLHEDKVTLAWMRSVETLAQPKQKIAEKISSNQLLTVMSDALHQTGFKSYTYQLQQVGEHEIQLSYDAVPYNFFLAWLSGFSQQYQFSIKQFHVEKTGKVGVVKVTLIIEADNA